MADGRDENTNNDVALATIEELKAENALLKGRNIQLQRTVISLKDEKAEMQSRCTCCITSSASESVQGQNTNVVLPVTSSKPHLSLAEDCSRYELSLFPLFVFSSAYLHIPKIIDRFI